METKRGIEFKDVELTCIECGNSFIWGAGEQCFYRDRGLSQPKRCPKCRELRKKKLPPHIDTDDVLDQLREVLEKWKA